MSQIQKYSQKLSGPILDRLDLHISVHEVEYKKLLSSNKQKSLTSARDTVEKARARQLKRYGIGKLNASLSNSELKQFVPLDHKTQTFLNHAAEALKISARSYMRIVKVARTIADLEGSELVSTSHISEAFQYRGQSTKDSI